MENQRKESDAEEERSSKRTPLLSSWVVSAVSAVALGDRGSHRRALLPRSRRVLPPRVPSPSCLASVTANPPPLLPGPIAITVTGRKGRKRIECEGEEEFSSLLYVQLSLLLPIPPLLLHRRLRSSSPWPRSAVKSNVNGKENKEAANGDLEKWLCSVSASGFYKLPESSALIGKANFLTGFLLPLSYFCRLLIFDNIENGSLKEHLNDPLKTPLNWRMRLQIANKVVAALEYLFLFNDPPAYHVSISSSNIMLDENFAAKIRKHFFSH
ncbi:putative receptor-like protein kinase [Arachis hypogaea]|nr:putative receptor-like protein kinase [Arachis hypogaea]